MLTISLEQLRFHAPIGFYQEERDVGNDFLIDVHIQIEEDGYISDISNTVDYTQVYALIKSEMQKEQTLVETVAQHCVSAIKAQWPRIRGIDFIIRKLHPPLAGEVGCSKITLSKNYQSDGLEPFDR